MGARERARSPVFGRVVSREPIIPQRISFEQRQRHLDGNTNGASQARLYGAEVRPSGIGAGAGVGAGAAGPSPRRSSKNRYLGVSSSSAANNAAGNHNSVAVHGSFQKLKELIWTERAKELTQQRRAEELAARAAVLKEIANGQKYVFIFFWIQMNLHIYQINIIFFLPLALLVYKEKYISYLLLLTSYVLFSIQSSYKIPFNNQGDSLLMDENRSPDSSDNQYLNGERLSIANVQNFDANNEHADHSNSGPRPSTRRIGSAYRFLPTGHTRKETYFTSNVADGQPKIYSRIRIPTNAVNAGDSKEKDQPSIGIPRTYPVRQSHFRERNRSLLKQVKCNKLY